MKIFFIVIILLLIAFSNAIASDTNPFNSVFAVSGVVGYSLPISPAGTNSYSDSYFPGWLYGAGLKYYFSRDFSLGAFYCSTSTDHRTEPSAKVSFKPIYLLEGTVSIASMENERVFISIGGGYSSNKVEGTKYPSEWDAIVFTGGLGFEYLMSDVIGLELDFKGFGFLPANDEDMLGISMLGLTMNYYIR